MKLLGILVLLLFVIGCIPEKKIIPSETITAVEDTDTVENVEQQDITLPSPQKTVATSCLNNADCAEGKLCIDKQCGTIAELYSTDCRRKCNYNKVIITTSDNETYTLSRGQGSYSYAGAIAWTLVPGPDYCPGGDIPIPIKIEKKTTGKILSEEIVTLHVGETSHVITHPIIKKVSFTMKVESIDEECS